MLDKQLKLDETHLSSFSPTYKMHARRKSTGDGEFDFSSARKSRLWRTKCSRTTNNESSPLLPHNHHYSNLSPTSRRRVITEGRRELMEMIQNMPESCYELSLKDIVDEQHSSQEGKAENTVCKDESSDIDAQTKIRKLKKKKRNIKRGQITRIESMESETFLIKMFFPTSLGSKKKARVRNLSEVPSIKSTEKSETDTEKVQWMKGFFVAGRNKKICRSSTCRSTGCWPFFSSKKSKSMRQKGCVC